MYLKARNQCLQDRYVSRIRPNSWWRFSYIKRTLPSLGLCTFKTMLWNENLGLLYFKMLLKILIFIIIFYKFMKWELYFKKESVVMDLFPGVLMVKTWSKNLYILSKISPLSVFSMTAHLFFLFFLVLLRKFTLIGLLWYGVYIIWGHGPCLSCLCWISLHLT